MSRLKSLHILRSKLGSSVLKYDVNDFGVVSPILQMATTYEVQHLRQDILRGLSTVWPKSLMQWEMREARNINSTGSYDPRRTIPHPMYAFQIHAVLRVLIDTLVLSSTSPVLQRPTNFFQLRFTICLGLPPVNAQKGIPVP